MTQDRTPSPSPQDAGTFAALDADDQAAALQGAPGLVVTSGSIHADALHQVSLDTSWLDDQAGDVDEDGLWVGLMGSYVLTVNDQGFRDAEFCVDPAQARARFVELDPTSDDDDDPSDGDQDPSPSPSPVPPALRPDVTGGTDYARRGWDEATRVLQRQGTSAGPYAASLVPMGVGEHETCVAVAVDGVLVAVVDTTAPVVWAHQPALTGDGQRLRALVAMVHGLADVVSL